MIQQGPTRSPPPALYRTRPELSRGRFFVERSSATRTAFQRDRDRIIHSAAFRRLALKTQVFLPEEGDHYRTRLTHTIEVAQITRTLTRALGLDDDLGEALALAHDLGHTPFGHTGEDALDEIMRPFGGFDHNAQTIRIVALLERRYAGFPGLNLSWETFDGLAHRGRSRHAAPAAWVRLGVPCFAEGAWQANMGETPQASGEAQAAALADDIAYNAHDLEDGLQAGFFDLATLDAVPTLAESRDRLIAEGADAELVSRGLARELVGLFVEGAIAESCRRLAAERPETSDEIRRAAYPMLALPPDLSEASDAIKAFLFRHMYRHPRLLALREQASSVVRDLAARLIERPDLLPVKWRENADAWTPEWHARRVSDYVASMTDRFAFAEHSRIFDAPHDLL